MFFQLIADDAGATFVADGRLQAVDAAGSRIRWYDMLLESLQFGGVPGCQGVPLGGGAGFGGEGA